MLPGIGPMELIVLLVIALLIFGPKKLPDLGRSLGGGMREFKKSVTALSLRSSPAAPALPMFEPPIPSKRRFQTSSAVAMRGNGEPFASKLISDGVSPPIGCIPKFRYG